LGVYVCAFAHPCASRRWWSPKERAPKLQFWNGGAGGAGASAPRQRRQRGRRPHLAAWCWCVAARAHVARRRRPRRRRWLRRWRGSAGWWRWRWWSPGWRRWRRGAPFSGAALSCAPRSVPVCGRVCGVRRDGVALTGCDWPAPASAPRALERGGVHAVPDCWRGRLQRGQWPGWWRRQKWWWWWWWYRWWWWWYRWWWWRRRRRFCPGRWRWVPAPVG
jgi:hypothetical protein